MECHHLKISRYLIQDTSDRVSEIARIKEDIRWKWPWRLSLLILATIDAFLLNTLRAIFLGWKAVVQGTESVDRWHDSVGITITALTLSLLVAAFLLLGGTLMASTMWFKQPDRTIFRKKLVIEWENLGHAFTHEEIPYRARTQLRYTESKRTSWISSRSTKATAYHFRWYRDRISLFNAIHRPEVCLPPVGLKLIESTETINTTKSNGTTLSFQGHQSLSHNRPVFV